MTMYHTPNMKVSTEICLVWTSYLQAKSALAYILHCVIVKEDFNIVFFLAVSD